MKVLMVLTSHDKLGNTGRKTGFWLEELAAPYYAFKDAGAQITLVSPRGGRPPLDPKSQDPSFQTDITRRFEKDADAEAQLDKTLRLDSVKQEDYDTVFYPGGHGPMWDLAEDKNSIKLIESFLAAGKPVALVCHAPGVLRHVKTPGDKPLVDGKNVTGEPLPGRDVICDGVQTLLLQCSNTVDSRRAAVRARHSQAPPGGKRYARQGGAVSTSFVDVAPMLAAEWYRVIVPYLRGYRRSFHEQIVSAHYEQHRENIHDGADPT